MGLREWASRTESVTATVGMTPEQRYILVEGEAELDVLRPHLGGRALIKELNGRPKVQEAWRVLSRQGADNFLALIDADFDEVVGLNQEAPRLVYVSLSGNKKDSTIDLESTLLRSWALQMVCEEFLGSRLLAFGGPVRFTESMRETLRVAAAQLGAFRAAVMKFYFDYDSVKGIADLTADEWAAFIELDTGNVDRCRLEAVVKEKVQHREKLVHVVQQARDYLLDHGDGWLLCRGHDMTALLALRLSHIAGSEITRKDVEKSLYAHCRSDLLTKTAFGSKLQEFCADFLVSPV